MILNTRPEFYRVRFHKAFEKIGLPILDCPVLRAESTGAVLPEPDAFDAVIFTSQFAISIFPPSDDWRAKRTFTVGRETARAARAAGFADVICTGEDATDMELELGRESFRMGLYACAQDIARDLSEAFPDRVVQLSTYRMTSLKILPPSTKMAIEKGARIIVPLFSRRSAAAATDLLSEKLPASGNAHLYAVGISGDIFAAEEGPWQCRDVAPSPTLDAVVEKTLDVAKRVGLISKVK